MRRLPLRVFVAALLSAVAVRAAAAWASDAEAQARAQGNRIEHARSLARVLLAKVWPAQVLKVRVDGVADHEIAGLVLSAVKFHARLDQAGFENEVGALIRETFASSGVEEADVWATVPIPYDKREPVSGDYAQPTSRIVFAVTCRRSEAAGVGGRLRSGSGVFWASDFKKSLSGAGSH